MFVVLTCWVTFGVAATGAFASPGVLEVVAAAVGVTAVVTLAAFRHPGWIPAALVFVVSLVPYQVSFVGKTPFGVVTATGALGFLAFAALLSFHARGRRELFQGAEVVAMAVWVGLLVASAALGPEPRQSLNAARLIAVAVPMAYLVGRLVAALDPLAARRVVIVIGALAALAVLEELTRFTVYDLVPLEGFPLTPPPAVVRSGLERVRLGYYHGSTLGTVLAVGATLVVAHRFERSRRTPPWIVPTLLVALAFTVTFQVWVASFLALAILGLGLRRVRLGLAATALAAGLVIMTGAVPALNQLIENRIHPTGSHADEYAYRAQLWPASYRYATQGPLLGGGTGLFNQLGITGTVRNATVRLVDDNAFTAKLVETGFPGVLAFAATLVLVGRRMLRNRGTWRGWAGLGALVAWTLMAFSVDTLAGDQALLPCWLLLGMLSYSPEPETP
jgi:hypothetical protein